MELALLLHKTLAEIVQISPLEFEIWQAHFRDKQEKQAKQKMQERQEAALKSALGRGR